MDMIAVFALASVAVGGVVYVFLYPILSGEKKTEQRVASVARAEPVARAVRGQPQRSRRDIVESSLKEFEARHKKTKSPPLSVRIAQAGLSWSKKQYII